MQVVSQDVLASSKPDKSNLVLSSLATISWLFGTSGPCSLDLWLRISKHHKGMLGKIVLYVTLLCISTLAFQVLWGTAWVYALESNRTACPSVDTKCSIKVCMVLKIQFSRVWADIRSCFTIAEENLGLLPLFFQLFPKHKSFPDCLDCLSLKNTLLMLFLQPATRGWHKIPSLWEINCHLMVLLHCIPLIFTGFSFWHLNLRGIYYSHTNLFNNNKNKKK